jgi:acyl-CoA hydrolase
MNHEPELIEERRTEIVFPEDTNAYGTLFGGRALAMMDVVGGIASIRACRKQTVTVSIDRIDFKQPIRAGEFVETIARVVKIGTTSITVEVELWAEHPMTGERRLSTVGKFIYVAITPDGKPTPVRDSGREATR